MIKIEQDTPCPCGTDCKRIIPQGTYAHLNEIGEGVYVADPDCLERRAEKGSSKSIAGSGDNENTAS